MDLNLAFLIVSYQAIIEAQAAETQELRQLIEQQQEQIQLLLGERFGASSEKKKKPPENPPNPSSSVSSKKRGSRKPLPDSLPRTQNRIDLSEEEKQCSCGALLECIGQEVSEKLNIIPARVEVLQTIRPQYTCRRCENLDGNPDHHSSPIRVAPLPPQLLGKAQVTEASLAHFITAKLVDALPFYRQEQQWKRSGVKLSRSKLSQWMIQVSERLKTIHLILKEEVLKQHLIQIDESTIQVLKEPGRKAKNKSYIWVMKGYGKASAGLFYYHYDPHRSGEVAQELLDSFEGVVQSDGYVGYDFLHGKNTSIDAHAGCWAHARRKFIEVEKSLSPVQKKEEGLLYQKALKFIAQLYGVDQKLRQQQVSSEERVRLRQQQTQKTIDEFDQWLTHHQPLVPPKSLLGKAINYTLNQWKRLTVFLKHPVELDNNGVENAIRPLAVGRKNYLFADRPEGATALARLYSLIETAKAHEWNPYEYLKFLFEALPQTNDQDKEALKALLPHLRKPSSQQTMPG